MSLEGETKHDKLISLTKKTYVRVRASGMRWCGHEQRVVSAQECMHQGGGMEPVRAY